MNWFFYGDRTCLHCQGRGGSSQPEGQAVLLGIPPDFLLLGKEDPSPISHDTEQSTPHSCCFHELFAGGCVQSEHKCKCLHEECSIHNEVKHEIAAV